MRIVVKIDPLVFRRLGLKGLELVEVSDNLGRAIRKAYAYLALSEWTFMASLEAFGTGRSGTSHSALAVRRGGELFVAESTFWWPGGDGVQVRRACVRARAFLLV